MSKPQNYPRIGAHKSIDDLRRHLEQLGLSLPLDDVVLSSAQGSPLSAAFTMKGRRIGNRWCVHPMEGWDGDGRGGPSEFTLRRWRHFGESGAKLVWGGEAFAVRADGRANPRQLFHQSESREQLHGLLATLKSAHASRFGPSATDDLMVGLQLTHSGRFCKPKRSDRFEPWIAAHDPVLDRRVGINPEDDSRILHDEELPRLVCDYVAAARTAAEAGFDFVDVKACHGYLLHEFLSATNRPGPYGGSFEGRTRLLREIVAAVRAECPSLEVGVRLSVFDQPAFSAAIEGNSMREKGEGIPDPHHAQGSRRPFGASTSDPFEFDPIEPVALLSRLRDEHGIWLINLTAGSPYYNPHVQRPAFYPPSDGYFPPEDPLAGCVRQFEAVRRVKLALPGISVTGSAYSYFQEFVPHVAQGLVREGWTDFVGIGRLVLSDWTLPARVLDGAPAASKKICRTFSDCTTAPRHGLISGCYPLDDHYKTLPEAATLKQIKQGVAGK